MSKSRLNDAAASMGRREPSDGGDELRSLDQLNMLHSLAARLNGLNDVREIGRAITAELRTIVEYHSCRVFVLQPDGHTLYPIAFRGELSEYREETVQALITQVGRGLTGHVAETARSYYTPDATHDPFATLIPDTEELDESILAVPLTSGRRMIGVLVLSKGGLDQFDGHDLRLLEVLGSHAAVAIENARLLGREREAASRARDSEARKSAILQSALDGVVVMDGRGMVEEFSPAAERTFGYSREEAVGRELAELIIPPLLRQRHRDGLARYLASGDAPILGRRIEMTAMRSDGTEFPVELAISKVDLPGADLFTGYIRDITERKRAEADVQKALDSEREAADRLRVLDEMKNTFLQAVSHDLRTPLAVVLGIALTLDREDLTLSPNEGRDLRRRLAVNARKLERMLSNLLDLERLKRGVVEASPELTDVGQLVRRAVAEADFLTERDVRLHADPIFAGIDPAKVERIVENLLVNAAKHTPDESVIWVSVIEEAGGIQIVVEDDGPGVPDDVRKAIFEPFRQGPGDHPSPGAGIGLSLVARFAELHGGSAWVQDREGGGASFRVRLPSIPQEATSTPLPGSRSARRADPTPAPRARS
ncbi:MAG: PAS domain S-box protein [Actinomycetota bacterium]|nr:PAS domain S-box protein [Actinomycetota bacterium]